jgi:hypothetical protein
MAKLCQALEHEDSRLGATNAIREMIEAILLEPDGEQLKITLRATWRLRGRDLNPRPLGYEPNELPDCSTPRHYLEGTDHSCGQPTDPNTQM